MTQDVEVEAKRQQPPPVKWAQRNDVLYLTIGVEECRIDDLTVTSDKLHFKVCFVVVSVNFLSYWRNRFAEGH